MWRVLILVFVLSSREGAGQSQAVYDQCKESEGHCKTNEDCGADKTDYLIHAQHTCSGRCGAGHDPSKTCQCNTHCVTYGDCCADYHTLCTQQTCTGRCNAALDNSKPCQCNSACVNFGDCCPDYQTLCVDGNTPDITCDISCLAKKLWDNDVNRVQVWEYEVNHQGQTTTSSTSDEATQK